MQRINVHRVDEITGRLRLDGWFDLDAAVEVVDEDTTWDGGDHVSVHARTWDMPHRRARHEHERLIRTAGGRWVLHHWSQWQGVEDTYTYVTDERAREWLLANGSDEVIRRYWGEPEPERGPGRPAIGGVLPPTALGDLLARVDEEAERTGSTRAATVRALIAEALAARTAS